MSETPIDAAYAALEAAGDDAGLRMAYYGQVLGAELFLILEGEPEGERLRPLVLDTDGGRIVLAFDLPERLAAFLDEPRDYVAVAGRSLVAMLAGQGIGIALNPDVAPSASIIAPDAVDWLAGTGARSAVVQPGQMARFRAAAGVPAALVSALEARLGSYAGRVRAGYLAAADHVDGGTGLVLALEGVPEAGEPAVAAAIDEAVRFSGAEGIRLDVIFPNAGILERVARVGIAFRPALPEQPAAPPKADRPPRLR